MNAIDPNSRDRVLSRVRRALGVHEDDTKRRIAVQRRLANPAPAIVPARAQVGSTERIVAFGERLVAQRATIEPAMTTAELPARIAGYLRRHNLPLAIRMGSDPLLTSLAWSQEPALMIKSGPADARDVVCLSRALAGAAETGTLALISGASNPTTLNFLPDTHIVVIETSRIHGPFEKIWQVIRDEFGERQMPRSVNLISGPSRTADIEQTIVMGAHGPRRLHVIILAN